MDTNIEKVSGKKGVVIREDKYGIEVLTMRNGYQWSGMPMDAELIDMLEQAIVEFKRTQASPASAPEGWKWRRHARTRWESVGHWDSIEEMAYNDMLGRGWDVEKLYSHAAPTPPVSEDRKDAELLDYIQNHGATIQIVPMANRTFGFEVGGLHKSRKLSVREAIDAAMQEDKP